MEIKPDSQISVMVGLLEANKRRLSEKTHELPANRESYLAIPLEERMLEAKKVLTRYANIGKDKGSFNPGTNSVETRIETDSQRYTVTGYAGYTEGSWTSALNMTHINQHPSILVWAKVTDIVDNIDSRTERLGAIEFHQKEDGSGRIVGTSLMGDNGTGRYQPIESPGMEDIVEIIDGVIGQLLDTTVASHRNLGVVALAK